VYICCHGAAGGGPLRAETGSFRQFVSDVPGSNYPTAALMSRTGKLYVGAAYAGHLLCFDPDEEALEDLGPINSGAVVFPLDPSALSLEVVVMAEGAFTVPGPILGRHIYFATGHRLRAAEVF